MTEAAAKRPLQGPSRLAIDERVVSGLRTQLSAVADLTVATIIDTVPSYTDALNGPMGETIAGAVRVALAGFLDLLGSGSETDAGTPLRPALDGAYALGRGEARAGRTMDALLAAYRVGARIAWREMSETAVDATLPAAELAQFAELVFAYIDELSAASVAGHSDELATTGRVRQRYLERLAQDLLAGATEEALLTSARQADWEPPESMVAVVLPARHVRGALAGLDAGTLEVADDAVVFDEEGRMVLLVPAVGDATRQFLLRHLSGREAVVGPLRPWPQVAASYLRASRVAGLVAGDGVGAEAVDSERYLAQLVCTADRAALADLRAQVLAPLAGVRPTSADRLVETLRSWLLHQGRRDDVAADLVLHPQTIRYRMTQIRELYGERLNDPDVIAALTIALALD